MSKMLSSTTKRRSSYALALRCLSSAVSNDSSTMLQFKQVRQALEDALEGVSYVRQSAHQAFLETEPGTRATTEEYMMRYQKFARDDLNKALKKHQDLLDQVGELEFQHLQRQEAQFQLTYADSLLAREKLDAALRRNAEKLADRAALTTQHQHQAGFVNKDPCKPAWELPM